MIAILDCETTGVDPKKDYVTEISAYFCDTEWALLDIFDKLLWDHTYPELTEQIEKLTGINDAFLKREGHSPYDVLTAITAHLNNCDAVVAHNAAFDRDFYYAMCDRFGVEKSKVVWVDSYSDVPYPKEITTRKLAYLALEHGMTVDPSKLHRAKADVELLWNILQSYDSRELLERARSPYVFVIAEVAKPWEDGGVQKNLAREDGYSWERHPYWDPGIIFPKQWVKRIKMCDLETEKKKDFPFKRRTKEAPHADSAKTTETEKADHIY
jgi:DNA polymerase III epsilon subunit-like protein